jgi:hypothetical protein
MSDYLNSLVTRTLRLAPVVQPRPASLFEPVSAAGPVSEAPFAVSENVATQEVAVPSHHKADEPFAVPVQASEHAVESAAPYTVPPAQALPVSLLPSRVTPLSTFLKGDWDRPREVRDQELSSLPGETDSATSATETPRHQPTASLIKPEVRIVSQVANHEPVQPLSTASPLAPTPSNATRADSISRSRDLDAQTGAVAEAPETVIVTIGRVDVRAIFAPPQAAPRPSHTQPQPLSLDEYLKQRSEGRR